MVNRLYMSGLTPMGADMPAVSAWFERMRALPSYIEAYVEFTPRYGNDPVGEGVWPDAKEALAGDDPYA